MSEGNWPVEDRGAGSLRLGQRSWEKVWENEKDGS